MVGDSKPQKSFSYNDIYEWLMFGYEIGYLQMDKEVEHKYYQWVDRLEEIRRR